MTTTELLEQLKAHALALPKAERARVARELHALGAELDDVGVDLGVDPSRIERRTRGPRRNSEAYPRRCVFRPRSKPTQAAMSVVSIDFEAAEEFVAAADWYSDEFLADAERERCLRSG